MVFIVYASSERSDKSIFSAVLTEHSQFAHRSRLRKTETLDSEKNIRPLAPLEISARTSLGDYGSLFV